MTTESLISFTKRAGPPPLENGETHPLLATGFRPFFLVASSAAVLLVPLWLVLLSWGGAVPYWKGTQMHSHEMLFGFTLAVVAGFLLTAGSTWTKQRIVSGSALLGLVALWLAGRLAPLLPGLPPLFVALIDLAFLPVLCVCFARALLRSENHRNYVFIALLAVLFCANLLEHLQAAGIGGVSFGAGRDLALLAFTLMILVVGGRVIPMFTRNSANRPEVRRVGALDAVALATTLLAVAVESLHRAGATAGDVLFCTAASWLWIAAGALHLLRMGTWGTLHARAPLLWILHFGWGATALALALRGAAQLGFVPVTVALHLLTIGGIGGLTLGMMTRVSLGHSGRMLVVPHSMSVAFVLLVLATFVRVVPPLLMPSMLEASWLLSGAAWTIAFALLLRFGLPIWLTPRADCPPSRRQERAGAVPREHGFWVMMGLSLTAGALLAATAASMVIALVLGLLTVAGATLVGREIRKNAWLQWSATAALGLLAVPVAAGGSGGFCAAAHLGLVLMVAYLSGGFSVRSVLEGARRRPAWGSLYFALGLCLAAVGAALLFALGQPLSGMALSVTLLFCLSARLLALSPRRLAALGLSISVAHGITASLTVIQLAAASKLSLLSSPM